MKSYEVKPTEENLINAINEDLIKRNEELVMFHKLLCAQKSSCSIAIDGKWGSGKTFFVKQVQLILNAMNSLSDMDSKTRSTILKKLSLKDESSNDEHSALAVYYDAWEHDNDSDPISSIIYDIIRQLHLKYDLSANSGLIDVALSVIDAFSGRNFSAIRKELESRNLLAQIEKERETEDELKAFFSEVLNERGDRLVVFIDELDRCRPSYAVQLLERIKHYLEDDRITFVFSVNKEQLQHTVKHHYGNDFDAARYLDRFFDLQIELPPADFSGLYAKIGFEDQFRVDTVCRRVVNYFGFQLRDMFHFYETVRVAIYSPTHDENKWNFAFSEGAARRLMLTFITPVVIGLRMASIDEYQKFISGGLPELLINLYINTESGFGLIEELRGRNGLSFNESEENSATDSDLLRELYDAIYVENYEGATRSKIIGRCKFDSGSKDFINKAASMLTYFSDYSM